MVSGVIELVVLTEQMGMMHLQGRRRELFSFWRVVDLELKMSSFTKHLKSINMRRR
jgi:hypothetical protein